MEKFNGLTQEELEELFNKLNLYGLYLLRGTAEALLYNHDQDGLIFNKAYVNVCAKKELEEYYHFQSLEVKRSILTKSLKKLSDKELEFLDKILEIDPNEVFNNPYNEELFDDNDDYNRINDYVSKEKNKRLIKGD